MTRTAIEHLKDALVKLECAAVSLPRSLPHDRATRDALFNIGAAQGNVRVALGTLERVKSNEPDTATNAINDIVERFCTPLEKGRAL